MVEHKVLVNVKINQRAKISRSEFLEKVKFVKHIRTGINRKYISFYITSIEEHLNLKRFHGLVNKGEFNFDEGYYIFAVGVPNQLYSWFKNNKLGIIERQIVNWLAASYFFDCDRKKAIMERQLYKPLLEKVHQIIDKYYSSFKSPLEGINSFEIDEEEYEELSMKDYQAQIEKYHEVSEKLCGELPPKFLIRPCDYDYLPEYGINTHHDFEFVEAYFLDKDWENIIKKGSKDNLSRSESRDDFWEKWKYTFSTYETKKSFVYEFFFEEFQPIQKKNIYKRERISQETKDLVWRRDEGKCIECGSKEKLEFDHIIPVSKGGSSTYRNVQLLCEKCNRKKYNKI